MKKQLLASLALLSLIITFCSPTYAQLLDPCLNSPTEGCLGDGGGVGWTPPPVPNQPAVTYALGTTGDVYISTNERIYEGIPSTIHLVKNGSTQVEVVKTFPLGTRVTGLKINGDKLIYILQYGNGYASTSVKFLEKDSLGHYVETSLFEELTGGDQGQLILSYWYSEFTILNGFAYVKKTTYTYTYQEQVCVPGLGCLENTEPPVFVSAEDIIYKQGLTSPVFEVVSSIPGAPTQSSRYSFYVLADNIYRTDSQTGLTTLWLQNNNQAGHHLQIVGVSEGYLLFRSTSGLNDITTNLIAVKITDDVPHPKLRLATDLSGVSLVAYQYAQKPSALVFRETDDLFIDSFNLTFGINYDVPNWDHVGLWIADEDLVYESMPAKSGTYYDPIKQLITQTQENHAVQKFHSFGSFTNMKYSPLLVDGSEAAKSAPSRVIQYIVIPITDELANEMRDHIVDQIGTEFKRFAGIPYLDETFMPDAQKGGGAGRRGYSCVGLIEDAAEQVGHNNGQGFIPNGKEQDTFALIDISLLDPGLLAYFAQNDVANNGFTNYMVGAVDPVDFLVTDPLGRRLGHIDGQTYNEIPNAYYSGDGYAEKFLIPNIENGSYQIRFKGLGQETISGIKSYYNGTINEFVVAKFLAQGEVITKTLSVATPQIFSPSDIVGRLEQSIVKGPYKARIKALMVMAENIEKQVNLGHKIAAIALAKAFEKELKLFLNDSVPTKGLSKQESLFHLNSFIGNLNP